MAHGIKAPTRKKSVRRQTITIRGGGGSATITDTRLRDPKTGKPSSGPTAVLVTTRQTGTGDIKVVGAEAQALPKLSQQSSRLIQAREALQVEQREKGRTTARNLVEFLRARREFTGLPDAFAVPEIERIDPRASTFITERLVKGPERKFTGLVRPATTKELRAANSLLQRLKDREIELGKIKVRQGGRLTGKQQKELGVTRASIEGVAFGGSFKDVFKETGLVGVSAVRGIATFVKDPVSLSKTGIAKSKESIKSFLKDPQGNIKSSFFQVKEAGKFVVSQGAFTGISRFESGGLGTAVGTIIATRLLFKIPVGKIVKAAKPSNVLKAAGVPKNVITGLKNSKVANRVVDSRKLRNVVRVTNKAKQRFGLAFDGKGNLIVLVEKGARTKAAIISKSDASKLFRAGQRLETIGKKDLLRLKSKIGVAFDNQDFPVIFVGRGAPTKAQKLNQVVLTVRKDLAVQKRIAKRLAPPSAAKKVSRKVSARVKKQQQRLQKRLRSVQEAEKRRKSKQLRPIRRFVKKTVVKAEKREKKGILRLQKGVRLTKKEISSLVPRSVKTRAKRFRKFLSEDVKKSVKDLEREQKIERERVKKILKVREGKRDPRFNALLKRQGEERARLRDIRRRFDKRIAVIERQVATGKREGVTKPLTDADILALTRRGRTQKVAADFNRLVKQEKKEFVAGKKEFNKIFRREKKEFFEKSRKAFKEETKLEKKDFSVFKKGEEAEKLKRLRKVKRVDDDLKRLLVKDRKSTEKTLRDIKRTLAQQERSVSKERTPLRIKEAGVKERRVRRLSRRKQKQLDKQVRERISEGKKDLRSTEKANRIRIKKERSFLRKLARKERLAERRINRQFKKAKKKSFEQRKKDLGKPDVSVEESNNLRARSDEFLSDRKKLFQKNIDELAQDIKDNQKRINRASKFSREASRKQEAPLIKKVKPKKQKRIISQQQRQASKKIKRQQRLKKKTAQQTLQEKAKRLREQIKPLTAQEEKGLAKATTLQKKVSTTKAKKIKQKPRQKEIRAGRQGLVQVTKKVTKKKTTIQKRFQRRIQKIKSQRKQAERKQRVRSKQIRDLEKQKRKIKRQQLQVQKQQVLKPSQPELLITVTPTVLRGRRIPRPRLIPLRRPGIKGEERELGKLRSEVKVKTVVRAKPIQRFKTVQKPKPIQKIKPKVKVTPSLKAPTKIITKAKVAIKPKIKVKVKTRAPQKVIQKPKLKLVPGVPRFKFKKRKKRFSANQGFNTFIKERGGKNFFKANVKPQRVKRSFNLGSDVTDKSTAATFKVVPVRKRVKAKDARRFLNARKFRRPRRGSKIKRPAAIERRRFRIDSGGEKSGITAKGLIAVRRAAQRRRISEKLGTIRRSGKVRVTKRRKR